MNIMPLGINYTTKKLLLDPIEAQSFGKSILDSMDQNVELVRSLVQATTLGPAEEMERKKVDLGDPRSAGWTFLVNSKDIKKSALLRAIRPLAEHRGMKDPTDPLLYNGEEPDDWFDWLSENYSSLRWEQKPHYILILGGPDQVPFLFQSILSTTAAVGRLDFETIQELETYVAKVIRLEESGTLAVDRAAIFFAPDGGPFDPTYFSHNYLAKPLAEDTEQRLGFHVQTIYADDASKANLKDALQQSKPALVFTASHGLGAPDEPLETQKRLNGAICCQHKDLYGDEDWLFTADDVPQGQPFLEGAVFFQFACYGYGTPAESDFAHWYPRVRKVNAKADFIAALPKKLLSHPQGPIAFIGHIDIALLHGFDDPKNPTPIEEPWNPRIAPYKSAIDQLLSVNPSGMAMEEMNERYNVMNQQIANTYDRVQRGKLTPDAAFQEKLAGTFLLRSDAQNYKIFGDPAARLRIPKGIT